MAYCPSCGSNVEGRFCAKCGTAVPAPGAPAAGAPPPAGPPPVYGSAPTPPPPGYSSAPPPPGYGQPQGGYVPPQQGGYVPPQQGGYVPPQQGGYVPPPPGYGPPQGGYVPPPPGAQYAAASGLQENVASALCYILGFITGIIFLVMAPYNQNRNIRFHAFQSIFFSAAAFALSLIFTMFFWNLAYGVGLWSVITLVYLCIRLAIFGLWIIVMFKAYQGQKFMLPVIGPLAEKQANS